MHFSMMQLFLDYRTGLIAISNLDAAQQNPRKPVMHRSLTATCLLTASIVMKPEQAAAVNVQHTLRTVLTAWPP